MPRDIELLVSDMLQACGRLLEDTDGKTLAELVTSPVEMDAILWNLTKLGEAIKQLPVEFRDGHPEVEWRRASRMRDFLVHVYFGVDWKLVLDTIRRRIPRLKRQLEVLLSDLASEKQSP